MLNSTKSKKTSEATISAPSIGGRHFTHAHLMECSTLGIRWNYNRQLNKKVAQLPDSRFTIIETLYHSHRFGVPCELHVRCVVAHKPGRCVIVDVPVEYFAKLPRA